MRRLIVILLSGFISITISAALKAFPTWSSANSKNVVIVSNSCPLGEPWKLLITVAKDPQKSLDGINSTIEYSNCPTHIIAGNSAVCYGVMDEVSWAADGSTGNGAHGTYTFQCLGNK